MNYQRRSSAVFAAMTAACAVVLVSVMIGPASRAAADNHQIIRVQPVLPGAVAVDRRIEAAQPVVRPPESAAAAAMIDRGALSQVLTSSSAVSRYKLNAAAIASRRLWAIDDGEAREVDAANVADRARAGDVFVERTEVPLMKMAVPAALRDNTISTKASYKLNYLITVPNSASGALELDAWALDGTGLGVDARENAYVGEFYVALANKVNEADDSRLPKAVTVAVTARGATTIDPRPVMISELLKWHTVRIGVPDVSTDTYAVSVSPAPGKEGAEIALPVSHPTIKLSADRSSMLGWGIDITTINVEATGLRHAEGLSVTLSTTQGKLDDSQVVLGADGKGRVRLRSGGSGGATISVSSANVRSSPLVVRFEPPWIFLACAALGGVVGAFARRGGRRAPVSAIIWGIVSAIVMTILYYVGIDWVSGWFPDSDFADSGEAAIFGLGFLGSFAGFSILKPGDSGGES